MEKDCFALFLFISKLIVKKITTTKISEIFNTFKLNKNLIPAEK